MLTAQRLLRSIRKDFLPPHYISFLIYRFKYRRDAGYIDKTSQI